MVPHCTGQSKSPPVNRWAVVRIQNRATMVQNLPISLIGLVRRRAVLVALPGAAISVLQNTPSRRDCQYPSGKRSVWRSAERSVQW